MKSQVSGVGRVEGWRAWRNGTGQGRGGRGEAKCSVATCLGARVAAVFFSL
ncbi:hypothetical protein E1A91_A06G206700v1 [Gossypium mustelinum]|uniref:Uncharacterized protein n=1 Tax=Gossypium mustelinum TaxID=34275 RepID=A0A5D2YYC1_GOSMU|nr:hypothetical protein E1A91_A06G206700v1 [Gossypium mustelinum]